MTHHSALERIAIVGGGIAGLAAARILTDAGLHVTVLDKARGPGGRASTRRRDAHAFDHGAQYFTARDPGFRAVVDAWVRDGVAAVWTGRIAEVQRPGAMRAKARGEPRYVGVPGMSAMGRALADALQGRAEVRLDARVTTLAPIDGGGWAVHADAAATAALDMTCDALLVCTPAPQALELLDAHTVLADVLRRATMTPCWAAMLAFDAPLPLDADGIFVNVPDQPLAWASRDSSKPGRPAGERWVLHATPAWTQAHLEEPPARVADALVAALANATGTGLPAPAFADAHRWRYAQGALDPAPGALVDATRALVVAGDWCEGGRIEGAWRSGVQAAERMLALRHARENGGA